MQLGRVLPAGSVNVNEVVNGLPTERTGRWPFHPDLSARKDPANDFLDGDFLNVNVGNGEFVQQGFADGNHAVTLDLELDAARALRHDFAVFAQALAGRSGRAFTLDSDEFGIGKTVHDIAEAPIEEDRAMINDDDPFAQIGRGRVGKSVDLGGRRIIKKKK